MLIELTKFLNSLSIALDFVEREILGVAPYHGQRVAAIVSRLATHLGFDKDIVFALSQTALLHDCALNEYFNDEQPDGASIALERDMSMHCSTGEKLMAKLPFYNKIMGAVKYHHERADGTGAFGKKDSEVPLYAKLIHLADVLDVNWSLSEMTKSKYEKICQWIKDNTGAVIDDFCAELFFKALDFDFFMGISGESVLEYLDKAIPSIEIEISMEALIGLASIFADITDYKSHFTWRHSRDIADKAQKMGEYYGYSKEDCQKLFVAGALHDIGKLMIKNDILEKPGKLTRDEYKTVQNHAMGTYRLLKDIKGLEEINLLASLHHEKLDGSGYPFGLKAGQLSKDQRLMACLDIYQALVEERPYKKGLLHDEAIAILNKMGNAGQLDCEIIEDINNCFKNLNEAYGQESFYHGSADKTENQIIYSREKEMWRCPVCGYVHEGFLPLDFICPRCEQPGSIFEKL